MDKISDKIPLALEKNITNQYGQAGRQWLIALPLLVNEMKVRLGLSDLKPVDNLSYNYVLSGFQGSQPVILKLGLDVDGLTREANALKAFAGYGVVTVLAESEGMLLLERAISGVSLKSYFPAKEDAAIEITYKHIKRLHQAPVPNKNTFPHVQTWLKALDKGANIPANYLHKAQQLRDNLLTTAATPVLLHGDLHHDNILQNGDAWVVIDPKGVMGEPAYEVAAFIRNPMPELFTLKNHTHIIDNRIARFASLLEISERRILDWCFVQAVLAWVWGLEDGADITYFQQLTEFFGESIYA